MAPLPHPRGGAGEAPSARAGDGWVCGAVLCGGASRRMGTDKAMLDWYGRPLAVHVADRLAQVASPVALAPGAPGRLADLGLPLVPDAEPGAGPLGALLSVLRWAPADVVAVVAVDMPSADPALLAMLARCASDGAMAAVPVCGGRDEVLHAAYRRSGLPALQAAWDAGERSVRGALAAAAAAGEAVVRVDEQRWLDAGVAPGWDRNLNRPDDLFGAGPA